jgi:hypothetical protein
VTQDLTKPDIATTAADREISRLAREVDRTRAEYQDAHGEERDQCWKLYQRAMTNYNSALAKQTSRGVV